MARIVIGIILWSLAGCLFLTLGKARIGGWGWSPLIIWSFTYSGMLLERVFVKSGLGGRASLHGR